MAGDPANGGAPDGVSGEGGEGGAPETFALPTPQNLEASDGTSADHVELTWSPVIGAENYEVSINDGPWIALTSNPSWLDTGAPSGAFVTGTPVASDGTRIDAVDLSLAPITLVPAAAQEYRVRAVSTTGTSDASQPDSGHRLTSGPVDVQWQRSAADSASDFTNLDGIVDAANEDTTAPENTEGRYYRAVLSAIGAGPEATTADRGYRTLGAPINVSASDGTDTGGVFVSWDAVPGAQSYQVHDGTSWIEAGATPGFRDENAPMGNVTFGAVTASDGPFLARVEIRTPAPVLAPGSPRTYKVRAAGVSTTGLESAADSGYRGIGGTLTVSLQRSQGDAPTNFASLYTGTRGPGDWLYTDYTSTRPVNPDGRYYRFELSVAGVPNAVTDSDRGYVMPRLERTYAIAVRTSNVGNAGTDECVEATFNGEYSTAYILFDGPGNDLQQGATNHFDFTSLDLGALRCMSIQIRNCDGDSGINGWHGIDVAVSDDLDRSWTFPLGSWLDEGSGFGVSETICID
jgi:hypothetical protein